VRFLLRVIVSSVGETIMKTSLLAILFGPRNQERAMPNNRQNDDLSARVPFLIKAVISGMAMNTEVLQLGATILLWH